MNDSPLYEQDGYSLVRCGFVDDPGARFFEIREGNETIARYADFLLALEEFEQLTV